MTKNPADQMRRRKRLRKVESLMLNGFTAKEIHDLIGPQEGVTYGTIRNDICAVRKAHKAELDELDELEGRADWLARLHALRRSALAEKDFRLVHKLDIEIAKLGGVMVDQRFAVNVTVENARAFIDQLMEAVFEVVEDPEQREEIQKRLAERAAGES